MFSQAYKQKMEGIWTGPHRSYMSLSRTWYQFLRLKRESFLVGENLKRRIRNDAWTKMCQTKAQ